MILGVFFVQPLSIQRFFFFFKYFFHKMVLMKSLYLCKIKNLLAEEHIKTHHKMSSNHLLFLSNVVFVLLS